MKTVQDDFDIRSKEIDEYFEFVSAIVSTRAALSLVSADGQSVTVDVTADLQKTLKANGFLLIYNLMESTISGAIEAIFEHLTAQRTSFDDLTRALKVVILRNAKGCNPENLEPNLKQITHDIINHTFKKDELFSGNLDARKIRETFSSYGITTTHRINGDCLLTIKSNRNDLSHGIVSFADCGKDYDMADLMQFKTQANAYLQATLEDIRHFLSNDGYLGTRTPVQSSS